MNAYRISYGKFVAATTGTLLVLISAGCLTTQNSMPTAGQLLERGLVEADANQDALYTGRALAMTSCAECHRQYFPQEYNPKRWPYLVEDMGERANLRADQIRALRAYMVAASKTRERIEAGTQGAENPQ